MDSKRWMEARLRSVLETDEDLDNTQQLVGSPCCKIVLILKLEFLLW